MKIALRGVSCAAVVVALPVFAQEDLYDRFFPNEHDGVLEPVSLAEGPGSVPTAPDGAPEATRDQPWDAAASLHGSADRCAAYPHCAPRPNPW